MQNGNKQEIKSEFCCSKFCQGFVSQVGRVRNKQNIQFFYNTEYRNEYLHKFGHEHFVTDKSKQCELSSSETRNEIKSAQTEVSKFELNVRDAIGEWDKARKSIVENPIIEMEKKIWKDFMNSNFEKMERVIESISANANKRKTQMLE